MAFGQTQGDRDREEAEAVLEAIRQRRRDEKARKLREAEEAREREIRETRTYLAKALPPAIAKLVYFYDGTTRPYGRRGTQAAKGWHYVYRFNFPKTRYPLWFYRNREGKVSWMLEEDTGQNATYQVFKTLDEALERVDIEQERLVDESGIPL